MVSFCNGMVSHLVVRVFSVIDSLTTDMIRMGIVMLCV